MVLGGKILTITTLGKIPLHSVNCSDSTVRTTVNGKNDGNFSSWERLAQTRPPVVGDVSELVPDPEEGCKCNNGPPVISSRTWIAQT